MGKFDSQLRFLKYKPPKSGPRWFSFLRSIHWKRYCFSQSHPSTELSFESISISSSITSSTSWLRSWRWQRRFRFAFSFSNSFQHLFSFSFQNTIVAHWWTLFVSLSETEISQCRCHEYFQYFEKTVDTETFHRSCRWCNFFLQIKTFSLCSEHCLS